jgi:hypothetical protein
MQKAATARSGQQGVGFSIQAKLERIFANRGFAVVLAQESA